MTEAVSVVGSDSECSGSVSQPGLVTTPGLFISDVKSKPSSKPPKFLGTMSDLIFFTDTLLSEVSDGFLPLSSSSSSSVSVQLYVSDEFVALTLFNCLHSYSLTALLSLCLC